MGGYDPYHPTYKEVNIVLHWFARLYFRIIGWKIVGEVPEDRKIVAIAGPHTANFDGILVILTSWIIRRKLVWMVKAEWTRLPIIGAFLKWTGAMGIDRSASHNTVEQVVEQFKRKDTLAIIVPPEGTRRKTNHWKTGFYWIAYGANVPILSGIVDYGNKEINLRAPLFHATGDIEADMEVLWDYYRGIVAKHPEKVSDFRLRPSGIRPPQGVENQDSVAETLD